MISIGNLKSAQLRKLFRMLQYHLVQNVRMFEAWESIHSEFTCFTWFWKIWKKLNREGTTSQPPCLNSVAQPCIGL
jgi:hypothetical protein